MLEPEVMAKFHEICKHGVLHYFTFLTVAIFGLCYVTLYSFLLSQR